MHLHPVGLPGVDVVRLDLVGVGRRPRVVAALGTLAVTVLGLPGVVGVALAVTALGLASVAFEGSAPGPRRARI